MNAQSFFTEIALPGAGILLIICIAGVILFPLIQAISDPKALIKPLIGLAAMALLYFIGYQLNADAGISSGFSDLAKSFPDMATDKAEVAAAKITRNVGAAFFVTYVLGALAIIGILFTEIAKSFR